MKLEIRSFFSRLFGSSKPSESGYSRAQMINSTSTTFYAWDGNLFQSDIVRSAIRPKANAIGKLNAKHIRGTGMSMQVNQDAYLRELLKYPNPYMSMQDFLIKMAWQKEIYNNAFAYVKRDDFGYVVEIYPIPFSSVELLEKGDNIFVKFRFRTGKYIVVSYEDIIHIRKDFNDNDFFGSEGITALKNIMEVINSTDQSVVSAIKNSAVIKWIMKFKQVLQPKDVKIQLTEFTKNYLDISNTGGAAASDPRYDLEQVKDDSYVPNAAQMEKAIQRLYSYFGVNDAIVQNKFDEEQWNAFYEAEIEPTVLQLSSAFTKAIFSQRERGFGNRIVFGTINLAYASLSTKLNLLQMVDRGALTPNEWRMILNLEPVEGGDTPIRRLDTATVKEGNANVTEPA